MEPFERLEASFFKQDEESGELLATEQEVQGGQAERLLDTLLHMVRLFTLVNVKDRDANPAPAPDKLDASDQPKPGKLQLSKATTDAAAAIKAQLKKSRASMRLGHSGLSSVYMSASNIFMAKCSLKDAVLYLYLFYVGIYLARTMLGGAIWERRYNYWQPTIRPGAQRNGSCVLKQDIEPSRYRRDLYQEARTAKRLAGLDYMASFESLSQFFFLITTGTIVGQVIAGLHLALQRPMRLTAISLLVDPGAERSRLRHKLARIVQTTFNCPDFAEQVEQVLVARCNCLRPQMHNERVKHLTRRHNRTDFLRMVFREKIYNRVMPRSVSYSSLAGYRKTVVWIFWIQLSALLVIYFINMGSMIVYQVYRRVGERLAKAQCERWQPDAQMPKHRIDFDDKFWKQNRQVYLDYGQNENNIPFHLYLLELRNLFSYRDFLMLLFNKISYMFVYSWFHVFYWVVYAVNFHFQLIWLIDIQRQLKVLNAMLAYTVAEEHELTNELADLEQQQQQLVTPAELQQQQQYIDRLNQAGAMRREQRVRSIYKVMAATYFNFELFRRQYEHARWMANHIAGYMVLLLLANVGFAYLSNGFKHAEVYSYLIIIISFICIGLANTIFVTSSIIIVRMRRISSSLLQCFANSSELSISMSYVVALWRRQLMCDRDFRSSYSMTLFGFELSPANMLTLNSYLLGLALIIYKTYYSK